MTVSRLIANARANRNAVIDWTQPAQKIVAAISLSGTGPGAKIFC